MELDRALTVWIDAPAGNAPALDSSMVFAAQWGVLIFVGMVALCWWAEEERPRERYTAIRCGLAVVVGLLLNQAISRHRFRSAFLAAAALIAVSRIYIGTHYLSDVVGGVLTAAVAVARVAALCRQDCAVDRRLVGAL